MSDKRYMIPSVTIGPDGRLITIYIDSITQLPITDITGYTLLSDITKLPTSTASINTPEMPIEDKSVNIGGGGGVLEPLSLSSYSPITFLDKLFNSPILEPVVKKQPIPSVSSVFPKSQIKTPEQAGIKTPDAVVKRNLPAPTFDQQPTQKPQDVGQWPKLD